MTNACSAARSFFYDLIDLNDYESLLNFSDRNLIEPYNNFIDISVSRYPNVVRLTAPCIGISLALTLVVTAVGNLIEGIFKGIANIFIGLLKTDMSKIKSAITNFVISVGVVGVSIYRGIQIGTVGSIGLIIAPRWTYDKII